MNKNSDKNSLHSILFICYGNTCRSPMAEGLAKLLLGDKIRIESAGLAPVLNGATHEAVEICRKEHGIDISHHITRSVADIPITFFDLVVILDSYVFEALKNRYPSLRDRFLLWDIEDPYGQDRVAFQKTAEKIKTLIEKQLLPLLEK
jgi:protein-tyrosine-phosphatase